MKQGFFPDMVYDQLYMEYKLPEGTKSLRKHPDNVVKDIVEFPPCYPPNHPVR